MPTDRLIAPYWAKVYALYNTPTLIQNSEGHLILQFVCSKPGCKLKGLVPRNKEKGSSDKGSTGRLLEHARACWGKDKVAQVEAAKLQEEAVEQVKKLKQGKLTVYYEHAKGKGQLDISIRNQSSKELWCIPGYYVGVLLFLTSVRATTVLWAARQGLEYAQVGDPK